MFDLFNGVIRAATGGSFATTHADDANAQSPSHDLPPCPFPRDSSPEAAKPTRTVIDLSSPTRPPNRSPHPIPRPETSRQRLSKPRISEDEKRLVGDYTVPLDAVSLPNPSHCMNMQAKPGSNKGFKPIDTITGGSHAPIRKPTTYGKYGRLRAPLIGQAKGAGQVAYLERQQNNAPKTPSRRVHPQEDQDRWSGGAVAGKRRKVEHVIDLAGDDDDDELLEVPRPANFAPTSTSYEIPLSARSPQSRMSIGSGSTVEEFKSSQATSEFRKADALLKSSQKKPRRPTSSRSQGGLRNSPFGGGALAIDSTASAHPNGGGDQRSTHNRSPDAARKILLQGFQQGDEKPDFFQHTRHRRTSDPVTSHHFPEARINECTEETIIHSRAVNGTPVELRRQHRPAPKRKERMSGSSSADELAPSPNRRQPNPLSKAKQAAKSGAKRRRGPTWPLAFARSYDYEVQRSQVDDDQAPVLLSDTRGWRVQIYDFTEGYYDTKILIERQHINKVRADDTSRIRLEGPRQQDGNSQVFDLEFVDTSDFLLFRDQHASSLTTNGKCVSIPATVMEKLFSMPLQPKNDKVGTSLLVHDPVQISEYAHGQTTTVSKTPLRDQRRPSPQKSNSNLTSNTTAVTSVLPRPSRAKRSAPTYIEESPEPSKVFKYSIEKGLGPPWIKSLEYGEGRQRAVVHFDDLIRLDEEEYLNDSLIDFYMIYLFKKLNVPADKVYFFNTYFFTRLTENSGRKSIDYKSVERWTSKVDIFTYDYIVVPINDSQTHWYLAIICNLSKMKRKPIAQSFDDDDSQVQELGEDLGKIVTIEENSDGSRPALNLSSSVQGAPDQQEDNDPNLFEEEALSLVNRDQTGTDIQYGPEVGATYSIFQEPMADMTKVEAKDTVCEIAPRQDASSAKNKSKRKPVPKKDPNQPLIVVLDSLGGTARSGAVRALKDWIAAEGKNRRSMEAVIKENGYYPKATQIPMQSNWTDCGVYLLGYVEKLFQNPDDFKDKLLTGSMSAEEDWPELKPSMMRDKMREIIFECHSQQERTRRAQRKAKNVATESKAPAIPTDEGLAGPESKAPLTGQVASVNSGSEKLDDENGQQKQSKSPVQPVIQSLRPRLGSPFKLDVQRAMFPRDQSPGAMGKSSDSSPVTRSPAKTPRRYSPEARVAGKSPLSLNGKSRLPHHAGPMHRMEYTSVLIGPTKRGRDEQDDYDKELTVEKRHIKSPGQLLDQDEQNKRPSLRDGEGSAPDMPIEIGDSQEVQMVDFERRQLPETKLSIQGKVQTGEG